MNEKAIVLNPLKRDIINAAISLEYDHLKRMGYDPDSMTRGYYPEEIVPLSNKLKSDALDLCDQEVLILQELLFEYRGHLEEKLDIPLVPEEYTTKIHALLEEVNILLEQIS